MAFLFRWDNEKAIANASKHGITFEEACSAFGDPLSVTVEDTEHSKMERRYILLGETFGHKLVVVSHAERRSGIRIISARLATRRERREYEKR
jgi:hypothetical protein